MVTQKQVMEGLGKAMGKIQELEKRVLILQAENEALRAAGGSD